MKYVFVISLLLTLSLHVFSQPVITRNHLMFPGDDFVTASVAVVPDPGSGGAQVIWDFSAVQQEGVSGFAVEEADETPYASDFPGANIAFVDPSPNASFYQYHFIDGNAWEEHGSVSAGSTTPYRLNYDDPRTFLQFPVMYNGQWQDNYTYTLEYYTAPPYTTLGEGSVDVSVDGYGSLILPQATFSDVLRVQIIGESTDTTVLGQGLYERNYLHDTTYVWLSPSYHAVLCTYITSVIERITTVISGDTMNFPETIEFVGFSFDPTAEPSSSLHDPVQPGIYALWISPNPVEQRMNVEFSSPEAQEMELSLQDQTGRCAYHQVIPAHQGENHVEVILSEIPSGMYVAWLKSWDGVDVQKIIRIK